MNLKATDRAVQLLDAAMACFARRGFHRTTMDEIAHEAGVSAGLIYRHYASKDDLVVAMVEQHQQSELERIGAAAAAPTLAEALDRLLADEQFALGERAAALLYAEVIAESLRNPRIEAVVRANSAAVTTALADLVAAAQTRGEADPELDPHTTATFLLAATDGLFLHTTFTGAQLSQTQQSAIKALYHRLLGVQSQAY